MRASLEEKEEERAELWNRLHWTRWVWSIQWAKRRKHKTESIIWAFEYLECLLGLLNDLTERIRICSGPTFFGVTLPPLWVEWLTLMRWRGRHCPVWVTQHHSEKLYYFYHQLNFQLQRTAGTPCATAPNGAGRGLWAITLWLLKKPWSVWYLICTRYILVDWLSAAWLLYRNTFILPGSSDIEWKE